MAFVIPEINEGTNVYVPDLIVAYEAVVEEARASVNRALTYPIGSGSRQAESFLAQALISLAGEIRQIYSGATPFTLIAEIPPAS